MSEDALYLDCAKEILKRLLDPRMPDFSELIYTKIMILRDTDENLEGIYDAYYKHKENEYATILHRLSNPEIYREPAKPIFDGWFHIIIPKQSQPMPRQRISVPGKIFQIMHKEYFTFVPKSNNANEAFAEVVNFLETLPLLYKELYLLNFKSQPPDSIELKIRRSLKELFYHPDSLVIHYRNPELGNLIRKTVLSVFQMRGVHVVDRIRRANRGFDVRWEENGEVQSDSHSMLVARVISKDILRNKNTYLRMTVPQFAKHLKASIIAVNDWSIEKVLHSL